MRDSWCRPGAGDHGTGQPGQGRRADVHRLGLQASRGEQVQVGQDPLAPGHGHYGGGFQWLQAGVIIQALHGHRDHLAARAIGPGSADLAGLEGVVFCAVAVNGLDIATALFGPQAMGLGLAGE